jgi:hypothetical protein
MFDVANDLHQQQTRVGTERFTARNYLPGEVLHLVLFRFSESTSTAQRMDAVGRFHALADSPRHGTRYIRSIVSGPQLSGEGAPGHEHAFIVTFDSLGDRNFYVGEPFVTDPTFRDEWHHEFKRFVGPLLEAANVFDLAPGRPA